MKSSQIGLLTTIVLGIFILIGALIGFLTNKKQKVVDFIVGLAFGIILMLMTLDLLPEIIEQLGLKYLPIFIISTAVGYIILKVLDIYIPDHEMEDKSKKEANSNLIHIGIITSLAIMLHNIIEGMSVYSTVISSTSVGITLMLGIGLHNIPFGIIIASAFHQSNQNVWKTIAIILLLASSTFIGGLIVFFLNISQISPLVLGTLLSITLGMLVYIAYEELYKKLKKSKNKKVSYIGVGIGILVLLIAALV